MKDKPETILIKLFGSTSRARILRLLCNDEKAFYQREIMFETGLSLQAVQRELENLITLGIIEKQIKLSRVYYQINCRSHFCEPLKRICELKSS
jgi:predicted transcriptional regulator